MPPPFNYPFEFTNWVRNNLVGTWVGSFSGFIHNYPRHRRSNQLPQLGGFTDTASTATDDSDDPPILNPANGFFILAGMIGLKFSNHDTLVGEFSTNSAGLLRDEPLTGTYSMIYHEELEIPVGVFSLKFNQSQGNNAEVVQNFRLMMRSSDKLHFLSQFSSRRDPGETASVLHRPTISQGVLHKTHFES